MSAAVVVEGGLAAAVVGPPAAGILAVHRPRVRRGPGRADLDPDAVVDALERAGRDAVVLARAPADDPGARALPMLAAVMGREVVRLPADAAAAAWVVAMAGELAAMGVEPARRRPVLVGAAAAPPLPQRPVVAGGARMPALRPGVLARWAGCVWRPCGWCGGGGLPGAACGRCGAGMAAAGAPR